MSVIFFFVTFFAMVEQVLFKRSSSILILCLLVKRGTGWFMQPEALHGIGRSNFFPALQCLADVSTMIQVADQDCEDKG